MTLISTTAQLSELCKAFAHEPYITIDTEFMRERTYWPKLCLVQLGGKDQAHAIDPLAKEIDLAPLFELLANDKITKVFHAGRQDVEIFVNLTGAVPANVADTQIMAMVAGFGDQASYETLATKLARAKIDKSSRFTDWAQRPLTEKQVTYALGDVTHLRIVYEKLLDKLSEKGRTGWIVEEMRTLTDLATYTLDPALAWQRLKLRNLPNRPEIIARLKAVTAWREREARRLDLPRGRLLRDEALLEIAHAGPASVAELAKMRGLPSGFAEGKLGPRLIEELVTALPATLTDSDYAWINRPQLNNPNPQTGEMLRVLLRVIADDNDVAAKLIADSEDLDRIASGDTTGVPALSGWRHEVFGRHALRLKEGRLAIAIEKNRIKLIDLDPQEQR